MAGRGGCGEEATLITERYESDMKKGQRLQYENIEGEPAEGCGL